MIGLIIALHVIICVLLIGIILVQAGRGGGLVENLSSVESMFGTKTNAFLTRTTTTLSVLFFITCVSLAFLSARQSRSLLQDVKTEPAKQVSTETPKPEEKTPAVQAQTPKAEAAPSAVEPKKTEEVPKTE